MISWEDTVMTPQEMAKAMHFTEKTGGKFEDRLAKAQAKISFPAGEKEEYKKWVKACMEAGMLISKPEQLVNLHKAGVREVVEWVVKENESSPTKVYFPQAQLKKWEVD